VTADSECPTEPLRRATRPLERLPEGNDTGWECGRCKGPVEEFSQGHYLNLCRVTMTTGSGFHFCCPGGCELHVP